MIRAALDQKLGRRVRNLKVELRDGEVILTGVTTQFYLKQMAQEGVKELVPEGTRVVNRIVVS